MKLRGQVHVKCGAEAHPICLTTKGQVFTPAHEPVSWSRWQAVKELGGEVPNCVMVARTVTTRQHPCVSAIEHAGDDAFAFNLGLREAVAKKHDRVRRGHTLDPLALALRRSLSTSCGRSSTDGPYRRYEPGLRATACDVFMRCGYTWPGPIGQWGLWACIKPPFAPSGVYRSFNSNDPPELALCLPAHWFTRVYCRGLAHLFGAFVCGVADETTEYIDLEVIQQGLNNKFFTEVCRLPIGITDKSRREEFIDYLAYFDPARIRHGKGLNTAGWSQQFRQRLLYCAPEGLGRQHGFPVSELCAPVAYPRVH